MGLQLWVSEQRWRTLQRIILGCLCPHLRFFKFKVWLLTLTVGREVFIVFRPVDMVTPSGRLLSDRLPVTRFAAELNNGRKHHTEPFYSNSVRTTSDVLSHEAVKPNQTDGYQSIGGAPLVLLRDVGDIREDHREGHSKNPRDRDQGEVPPAQTGNRQVHVSCSVTQTQTSVLQQCENQSNRSSTQIRISMK